MKVFLFIFVCLGHKQLVDLLLQNGANVSLPNNFGTTPLHWAASKGFKSIAELLIKNGANINYVDAYGKTPLDLTAMHGNYEIL